jgi:hypothetical protein
MALRRLFKWFARLRVVRRRTVWCLTWVGFLCILTILAGLAAVWISCGESYLTVTCRTEADILVVEGWIGRQGIAAAADEFQHGGYRLIICTGGFTSGRWEDKQASYAEMAASEMVRLGVPQSSILVATAAITENHRTFESAVAVRRTLQASGVEPKGFNVFTFGPHARRSALVFAKVNSNVSKVGVIGWVPSEFKREAWWHSSERSRELLEETVGYVYEVLLNSGRGSNSPAGGVDSNRSEQLGEG